MALASRRAEERGKNHFFCLWLGVIGRQDQMIFPSRVLCRQLFYCKANQLSGEYISGRSCVVLRAGFPELLHMERSPVIISVWNSDECFPLEQPLCPGPQVFSFYFQTSKVCFEIKGLFQPHKPTVFPRWKKFRSNQLFFFFWNFIAVSSLFSLKILQNYSSWILALFLSLKEYSSFVAQGLQLTTEVGM